jgi:type 1 glutamine amidotransferase
MTPPAAPRALLLLGQAPEQTRQFHNQPEHWGLLAAHLRAADLSVRTLTDDPGALTPQGLAAYDVVLNFSTGIDPTPEQVDALLGAVRAGAGFVGLHAATATFLGYPDYLRMVGGRFRRHDPIKRFTIRFVDRDHPISAGLDDYEHEDELYELTADVLDRQNDVPLEGVRVLAEAEGHPMVYVKEFGAGRVAYLASGHDERSLGHPTYRTLFTRAVGWAARRG